MRASFETARIDVLIDNQRRAVFWYSAFAAMLLIAGIAILVLTTASGGLAGEGEKTVLGIGAALISAASAFPMKEILARKDKICVFALIRSQLQSGEPAEWEKLREIIWDATKQSALL